MLQGVNRGGGGDEKEAFSFSVVFFFVFLLSFPAD